MDGVGAIYLTRRFAFSASHRLWDDDRDETANQRLYGACTNIHGHNYRLEVTLRGTVDPATGFFCNVLDLERLVREWVVDACDHRFLNEVPLFEGRVTTMENLAQAIWEVIEEPVRSWGAQLYEILLAETDDNIVRLRVEST